MMKKTGEHTREVKIKIEKRNFSNRRRMELVNAFKEVRESLKGKRNLRSFEQLLKEPE